MAGPRFYGWRIVAVAFVCDFVAVGFMFYSYGVFFKAMAAEFGGSRLQVSLGLTFVSAVGALVAPFVGRSVDHRPVRRIILVGTLLTSTGFLLLGQVQHVWQLYLVLGTLIAVGLSTMGHIPPATLVANWFVHRRGTALGLATMGISLSGLVMPPLATWLIDELGWRGGYLVYGVATLCLVGPPVALVVVDRPEDVGLAPDDDRRSLEDAADQVAWSTSRILRSRGFWVIGLCWALTFTSLGAILTHLVPHLTDIGVGAYRAATLLSIAAGCGLVGKVVFGRVADAGDPRSAVWLSLAAQVAGLLLLTRATTFEGLVPVIALFGLGMGGAVPLQSLFVARYFGRRSYGKARGLLQPLMFPLQAIGIPLGGFVFDETGSYGLAFTGYVCAYGLAAATLLALPASELRRGRAAG